MLPQCRRVRRACRQQCRGRLLPWNWKPAIAETSDIQAVLSTDQLSPTLSSQFNPGRRRHANRTAHVR